MPGSFPQSPIKSQVLLKSLLLYTLHTPLGSDALIDNIVLNLVKGVFIATVFILTLFIYCAYQTNILNVILQVNSSSVNLNSMII